MKDTDVKISDWLTGTVRNGVSPERYNFVEDTQTVEKFEPDGSNDYGKILCTYEKYFIYRASLYKETHDQYLVNDEAVRKNILDFCERAKRYNISDPDLTSGLLQEVYHSLWPEFFEMPHMQINGGKGNKEVKIASDTMTSVQNIVNAVMRCFLNNEKIGAIYKKKYAYASTNSSIALAANNERTGFYRMLKETCPNLGRFLDLYHTIGNYCPVPAGFNSARAGSYACHDYWDLTLMKIRDWYLAAGKESVSRDDIIQKELLHKRGDLLNYRRWLESFGDGESGWRNFVEILFMQDYLVDYEAGNYKVDGFWTGHSWENCRMPNNMDEINMAVGKIICRIEKRAAKIVDACKGKR